MISIMIKSRQELRKTFLWMVFILLLCPNLFAVGETPKLAWTEQRPKPDWWDEMFLEEQKPVRGGYIHLAAAKYIGLMNPNHWPINDFVAMMYFYESLMSSEGDFRASFPWLAESFRFDNPLSCTIKLRAGITYHDDTPFNADSVKYNFDWIFDPKNGAWTKSRLRPLKKVEVVDEYTVRFHFKEPWAAFLSTMTLPPAYAVSKKALIADSELRGKEVLERRQKTAEKKVKKAQTKVDQARAQGGTKLKKAEKKLKKEQKKLDKIKQTIVKLANAIKGAKPLDNHPVGTGPYMLEEGRPGNYLKLKRNPNWWFGMATGHPKMPYPDGVTIFVIPDPAIQIANLRAGKIDQVSLSAVQHRLLKNDRKFKVFSSPGSSISSLFINHSRGPTKDLRVRKAISHAIDRKALVEGLYYGQATIASALFPPQHWCHNPSLKPVTYDPELSKRLLKEAGFENGFTITGMARDLETARQMTLAIQNMLAKVGITWKVAYLDMVALSDRFKNLEYDMSNFGFVYAGDPDQWAANYLPDAMFNYGRSHNKKAQPLILAGRKELDEKKRQKIYWEFEKVLQDNTEDVYLWHVNTLYALRKNVRGYNPDLTRRGGSAYFRSRPLYLEGGRR